MLEGGYGPAVRQAMRILCAMAAQQGAQALVDVTQVHIDGCIYASPANLTFAERMAELGAEFASRPRRTRSPSITTTGARKAFPSSFGFPASRLADAYVRMGCRPTYTCSPYLLDSAPKAGRIRRLVGIKRRDLRQLGARRTDRETPRLPRPLHCTHRTGAAVGGLSRLQSQGAARHRRRTARGRGRFVLAAGRLSCRSGLARPHSSPARAGRRRALTRRSQGALRRLRHDLWRSDAPRRGCNARGRQRSRPGRGPCDNIPRRYGFGLVLPERRSGNRSTSSPSGARMPRSTNAARSPRRSTAVRCRSVSM